ncbi:putative fatty acid hydroxylase [Sporocytophaga myxococcoides]|uniref:Putative fatty acid hydroxylase n=1 Tax=Sporocytophaga myxococcoides TaxID=153721 RepID=A0A098L8P0_9BACT|nr:sterol desaturase family protein [Sporocytophaga myxococcoides]GAL83206.1 putative fatty acid hydroxylase [Sporocytophaga myxococcoides]
MIRTKTSQNAGSPKLFENRNLEKLTHTHIAVPIGIFIIFSSFLLCFSFAYTNLRTFPILLLFFTGMIAFTLAEYLMHRFLYHINSTYNKKIKRLQYLIHGVHHDHPKDKSRLAMPPILSLFVALLLLLITYMLINDLAFAFLPGFVMGYTTYLYIHYSIHAYPPPRNKLRILWKHHAIHHYKDSGKAFGVSSPFWDYVFKTMPEEK